MAYFLYNLVLSVVAVAAVPYYLVRGWMKGQPWSSLPQRLGWLPLTFRQTLPGSIWLHAVSVGEALSCGPLVEELRRRYPNTPIFLSTATVTGQQLAWEKLSGRVDGVFYAPVDLLFAVRRVLRALRPGVVVVAETEIWPNLFRETKRFGAGLLLVNARISDRSFPRYRRARFFFSRVLCHPDAILAQSGADRERFIAAGAEPSKVQAGGNLKYDFEPAAAPLPKPIRALLDRLQPQPLIVAGSTREGEERHIVEAFRRLAGGKQRALWVIAPRHPQRFGEVARLLESEGISFVRRSALSSSEAEKFHLPGILLLDGLGELSSLYPLADVVFVGGSLNGWGGHNVLEPAFSARPVVVGPAMQNFREIAERLLRAEAMIQVQGPEELAPTLGKLLEERTEAEAMGARARQVAESQRGAARRALQEMERLYDLAVPQSPPKLGALLLLGPLALLWRAAASFRVSAYEKGWLKKRRLRAFTLCVGNLTAGGVGKTPVVLWLTEKLHQRERRVGVLLRGYRRASPERKTVALPQRPISPLRSGDEAQILLRHFANLGLETPVALGADRYHVGSALENEHPLDLMILDDGFQHLQLERDFDLVLIDVTQPLDHLLPLGRLREPPSGLSRATAILLTHTEPGRTYEGLKRRLRAWNSHAPIFHSRPRLAAAVDAATGANLPIRELRFRRTLALCGIGNPGSFWRSLRNHGLNVVHRMRFRDHHHYSPVDVHNILMAARHGQAEVLVTTEKDLVNLWHAADSAKLASTDLDATVAGLFQPLPVYWIRIRIEIDEADALMGMIEQRLQASNVEAGKASMVEQTH